MRTLNGKLLLWILGTLGVLAVGVHSLHGVQVRRTARALLHAADRAEQEGDVPALLKSLRRYLAHVPDDCNARASYGLTLDRVARSPSARRHALGTLERALRGLPQRHDVRRAVAGLALELGRFSEAREHFEVLHRTFPADVDLIDRLARCSAATAQYGKAADLFSRALRQDPKRVSSCALLADLLRRNLHERKKADAVMDEMIKRNGGSVEARLARARYRLAGAAQGAGVTAPEDSGDLAGAVEDVTVALKGAPDNPEVLATAADLALRQAQLAQASRAAVHLQEARKHLGRAAALRPKDHLLQLALADLESRAGDPAAAAQCLRRARELLPPRARQHAEIEWRLADLLIQDGGPEARREGREILGRLRNERFSPVHLSYLQARLHARGAQWLKAARLLEGLLPQLAKSPQTAALAGPVNLLLGVCYQHLGDTDRQYEAFRRAAPADPADPGWAPAHLGMASALADLDWIDEALDEYQKLLPRAPKLALPVARLQFVKNLRLPAGQRDWPRLKRTLAEAARALPGAVEVTLLQADALLAQSPDHPERARELLQAARKKHPKEAGLWVALAALAERDGKDGALDLLRQAERQLGDVPSLRLARCRYWAGRQTKEARVALARLSRGLERFSAAEQQHLLHTLAEAAARAGDVAEARRLWALLAERRPDDLAVRLALFDLTLKAGDEPALLRVLADIERIEGPRGMLADYGTACHLIWRAGQGDKSALAKARPLLHGLAGRRPTWARVPLALARADELEGDTSAATSNYLRAIDLGERSPIFIRRAAELLYERQRYLEADQVVRKLPESALAGDLQRLASAISLHSHDYERALSLAEQAVAAGSKDYRDHIWLGRVLASAPRRQADAERALRRAAELARDVPDPWVALVQYLARTDKGRARTALHEAERILSPAKAPLALAQCCEAVGDLDRARALYESALAAIPADVALLHGLAAFHLRTRQPAKAQPYLHRLVAHKDKAPEEAAWAQLTVALLLGASDSPSPEQSRRALELVDGVKSAAATPDKQRARAAVLAARGTRAERLRAITLLEDLAAKQPLRPDDQFLLAQLHEAVGDWPKAHDRLRPLVAAHGDNPLFVAHYAARLLRHKELDQAGVWLEKLEKLEPKTYRTLELKALLLREQGKAAEAATLVRAYARGQDSPGQPAGDLPLIARLFEALGQTADAEKTYRRFVARSGRPEAALALAEFLGRRNRPQEALELCERSWSRCPPEAVAASTLAVLQATGVDPRRYERLGSRLREAARANPKAPGLWAHLAVVRKLEGRYAEAEDLFRKVIDGDNRQASAMALNNLAWLLALRNGRGAEAFEMVSRAIDLVGPRPGLLDTRAVIYLSLGQPGPAVKDLEAAVADGASAPRYFHLARAHRLANNRPAAVLALRKAKDLGLKADDLDPLERPAYDRLLDELTR